MNTTEQQIENQYPKSLFSRENVYIVAQLYLESWSFKPYTNGRGGVHSTDCPKHATAWGKIINSQHESYKKNRGYIS